MGETARIDRRRRRRKRRRSGERVECWSNLSGDEKISVRTCERWMHRNNECHLIPPFFLSLLLSLAHTYTLTPNFPHFNPNPTDSPTVRLRIYGRPRIWALPWDCLVRAKTLSSLPLPLRTKSSEYTSISSPSTLPPRILQITSDILK